MNKINKPMLGFILIGIAFVLAIISISSMMLYESWLIPAGYYLICWVLLITGLLLIKATAANKIKNLIRGGR